VGRKKSVLDAVPEDLTELQPTLSQPDRHRLDEHLTLVRELERAIASLPSDYGKNVKRIIAQSAAAPPHGSGPALLDSPQVTRV
jgi:hypothetical protein